MIDDQISWRKLVKTLMPKTKHNDIKVGTIFHRYLFMKKVKSPDPTHFKNHIMINNIFLLYI